MNRYLFMSLCVFFMLPARPVPAGKKKSPPALLLAGSAERIQIFDSLDPSTAGYPAWTTLSGSRPACDRTGVDRMFGPELERLLKEREKKNKGKPTTFGIPEFQAPGALLKKYMARHCQVGPGTTVAAHGPGWIKKVKLHEFSAKLSPFSFGRDTFLSISGATNLKERPFFYTTIVPASKMNHYQAASDLEIKPGKVSEKERRLIEKALAKPGDSDETGSMRFYRHAKAGLLARVERSGTRGTNPKYHATWFDYVLVPPGQKKALVVFRGDSDFIRESNQMELSGVLDLEGDGDLEILLAGAQCIVLALRTNKGFETYRLSSLF